MILAGSDTTATTLAFALYHLSRRPDVLEACRAEAAAALAGRDPADVPAEVYQSKLPLIAGVANESLRMYPAVTETGRISMQASGRSSKPHTHFGTRVRCLRLLPCGSRCPCGEETCARRKLREWCPKPPALRTRRRRAHSPFRHP